jgi:hypothetical protein
MKSPLFNGQHLTLNKQIQLLSEFVMTIDDIPQILTEIEKIPDAWLGAGTIFQNVWNRMHGYEVNTYIKDIDILYWDDKDLSWDTENDYMQTLTKALSNITIPVDVKNIARIHLWYEARFGIPKTEYFSVQDSISTWPVIGACMAMRMQDGVIEFIAPYGFQDMFSLRVRPNKVLVNQGIYENKAFKWKEQWPKLSVEEW